MSMQQFFAESIQWARFRDQIVKGTCRYKAAKYDLDAATYKSALTSSFITFASHVQSRISYAKGEGFYTIGPCGEELLAGCGLALRNTDLTALHYRHLATQVARQLQNNESVESIILNRARAHVCSDQDVVTKGNHCSLGVSEYDFLVTSTLASQAPSAVGRALGISLIDHLGLHDDSHPVIENPKETISYCSLGDGSVNNAHFLSARNLADYAEHRKFNCPVLFGISDNQLCISLPGHKYLTSTFLKTFNMEVFQADGQDLSDIVTTSSQAADYVRQHRRPATIIYKNLPRRFGHAATDRQHKYLQKSYIDGQQESNPLEYAVAQAVHAHGNEITYQGMVEEMDYIMHTTEQAFEATAKENKPTTNAVNVPLALFSDDKCNARSLPDNDPGDKPETMRKLMNRCYDEILTEYDEAVYIGEDVTHGGYYLVTEGLVDKHKRGKIADFPPDETSLIGVAIGYSQVGLVPIVEIPYAKYLDCGSDMFHEAAIACWLSNGTKNNGMVIRLQGFDKGKFGGNFHTHNSLHMPPGVDVVCYSNGEDYVKGMRYAIQQAKQGRVVMTVDSTALLNLEGEHKKVYPSQGHHDFEYINVYPDNSVNETKKRVAAKKKSTKKSKKKDMHKIAVVSYGNGVNEAKRAREMIHESEPAIPYDITIIDTPYISDMPASLLEELTSGDYDHIVFFDNCKQGASSPYAGFICTLPAPLRTKWSYNAAPKTYNPLGQLTTFITAEGLMDTIMTETG